MAPRLGAPFRWTPLDESSSSHLAHLHLSFQFDMSLSSWLCAHLDLNRCDSCQLPKTDHGKRERETCSHSDWGRPWLRSNVLSNSDRSPIWCFCFCLVKLSRTRRPCSTSRARMASRRLLCQLDLVAFVLVLQGHRPDATYFSPLGTPFQSPRYPRCSRRSYYSSSTVCLSFFDWSWLYGQFFDHFHSQHVSEHL